MSINNQIRSLEWFKMSDGRPGFRGTLGGYPRQIIGKTKSELNGLARRMARGEA